MIRLVFSILCLLLVSAATMAEVVSKSPTGFSLKITGEAPVTPAAAYDQFVQIGEWWTESHTYYGDGGNLSLEPKAGGCFCERAGNNEVMHMLITYIKPGEEIRMTGGLGPLQMMGVHGGMSWSFSALDNGNTLITQTYNVTGYSEGGLGQLADIVDQVQTGQLNALVSKLTPQ